MKDSRSAILKRCPKCGNEFRCMGEEDCWCEGVRLNKKEMFQILQAYADCLCPGCLRSFETE